MAEQMKLCSPDLVAMYFSNNNWSHLAPALFTSKVLSYDNKKAIFYGLHKGTRRVKIAV